MVVVTSLGPPEEGVRLKVENTGVFINRKQLGMGVLYISEARVSWVGIQGQVIETFCLKSIRPCLFRGLAWNILT